MTVSKPALPITIPCPECKGQGTVTNPVWYGQKMRNARRKAGLSLRQMARAIGLSAGYLCDMEKGKRPFPATASEPFLSQCAKIINGK